MVSQTGPWPGCSFEYRPFQTGVGLIDFVVAAFTYGTGHLPLKGHQYLVLRRTLLQALQCGKVYHHRGIHDGHVVVLKVGKRDLADVGGGHADLKAGGGGVVQGADGVNFSSSSVKRTQLMSLKPAMRCTDLISSG